VNAVLSIQLLLVLMNLLVRPILHIIRPLSVLSLATSAKTIGTVLSCIVLHNVHSRTKLALGNTTRYALLFVMYV